ncbi:MAG: winged helix-turn-helix domain-containing protein [Rhizobiaceae bacterium]|nr:winged helix-turn-helix domain-containing protein [Rhizobiaceae bacterium]
MEVSAIAKRMNALGNETRLAVFRALVRAGPNGVSVGRIRNSLNIPASTLTHHLHRLIDAGLACQKRQGTLLMCFAEFEAMTGTFQFFVNECCAEASDGKVRKLENCL